MRAVPERVASAASNSVSERSERRVFLMRQSPSELRAQRVTRLVNTGLVALVNGGYF